jgi:hypothetical protein
MYNAGFIKALIKKLIKITMAIATTQYKGLDLRNKKASNLTPTTAQPNHSPAHTAAPNSHSTL